MSKLERITDIGILGGCLLSVGLGLYWLTMVG
jgi:hypothetical protein